MSKYNGTSTSILRRLYSHNKIQRRILEELAIRPDCEEKDFPQFIAAQFNWCKALAGDEPLVTYVPISHRYLIPSEMGKTYESGFNGYSWGMRKRRQQFFSPTVHYNGLSSNRFVNAPAETLLNFYINGAGQTGNLTPQYVIEAMGLVIEKRLQQNIAEGHYWPLTMFTKSFWRQHAPLVQPYVFPNNALME